MVSTVQGGPQSAQIPPHKIAALADAVRASMERVVVGKRAEVLTTIGTFLAGGHLLIEDVPGLGKTSLALALARCWDVPAARIQFTADLLPADITGVSVYEQASGEFRFHRGPIFSSVVVADEMNRATPRAQSALLEAMGEGKVSVEGRTLALPSPFFVIATQNPLDMEGTYALPEAQRDRFMARMQMGYPAPADEQRMLLGHHGLGVAEQVAPVANGEDARLARQATAAVRVAPEVAAYVVAILGATREHPGLALGASPRAGVHLLAMARAGAIMDGRDFATPSDVARVAPHVLTHRLLPSGRHASSLAAHEAASEVLAEVLARTPVNG